MLTEGFFQSLRISIRLSNIFLNPISLKSPKRPKNGVRFTRFSRNHWLFCIVYLYTIFYTVVYLPLQIFRASKLGDLGNKSFCIVALCEGVWLLCVSGPIFFCPDLTVQIFNSTVFYMLKFKDRWLPEYSFSEQMAFDRQYFSGTLPFIVAFHSFPIILTIHGILSPQSGPYLTSILPAPWSSHPVPVFLTALHHLHFFYVHNFMAVPQTQISIAFTILIFPLLLNDLRSQVKGQNEGQGQIRKSRFIEDIRSIDNFPSVYRSLNLMISMGMEIYGTMLFPTMISIGQGLIFATYTFICNYEKIPLSFKLLLSLGASVGLSLEMIVLVLGGKIYTESKKTLRAWKPSWNNMTEAKYIRKLKKSFRPLRFELPGYFKISNLTLIKFLKGVTRGTFRALLTLK